MGGPGSGRRRTKTSVADCRVVEIGELCDAGRLVACPRGVIRWLDGQSGARRGRLSYTIAALRWYGGERLPTLTLHYQERPWGPQSSADIMLLGGGGQRTYGECPACARRVRKLYAPPGKEHFFCWRCHGLLHRRVPPQEKRAARDDLRAAMGSLLQGLPQAAPGGEDPAAARLRTVELLAMLAEERPLDPQELRIYCLQLAQAGYSLRRIAALVGSSKSSVGRYLAAGLRGVDLPKLHTERLQRYHWNSEPTVSPGAGTRELLAAAKIMERRERRSRGNREPLPGTPEKRVLRAQGPNDEISAALARRCVGGEGPADLPCSSELCDDREPPCPHTWHSWALRAARYERATPLWPKPCRSWHERPSVWSPNESACEQEIEHRE
jgi:hypothetical protein